MASTVTKLIAAAAGALAGTAVAKELNKPPDQRTWHGEVAGVPYDFRPPTVEKLKRTLWDPDSPQLFPPHAFGVGWSINLARLVALAQPATVQPGAGQPVAAEPASLDPAPASVDPASPSE